MYNIYCNILKFCRIFLRLKMVPFKKNRPNFIALKQIFMGIRKIFFFTVLTALFTLSADAQCRSFVKKKCLPSLAPYTTNGQINTAQFATGDQADIPLSFFENTSYKIIVCSQEVLGNVNFKILDAKQNVLFDNADKDFVNHFEFKSSSNQTLTLHVEVPDEKKDNLSQMMHTGCVSVIIGFKK